MPHPSHTAARGLVDRLRDRRVELGLSQRATSRRAGANEPSVYRWENGHMLPSLPYLIRWAAALGLVLSLGGCALFQQVPGRVTNGTVTSEAGGVWGKTTTSSNGCPAIEFMGNQDVGKVTASCEEGGKKQSLSAEAISASTNLKAAIDGMTTMGAQVTDLAKSVISAFGTAGKVATGGLGAAGPTGAPGFPVGSAPMLVCPVGTIITMQGDRPVCE